MKDFVEHLYEGGARKHLVVVLHGYTFSSGKMKGVCEVVRASIKDTDIYVTDLPFSKLTATTPSVAITAHLIGCIDRLVRERESVGVLRAEDGTEAKEYAAIILVGHSCGGVLVRKLFLAAHGAAPDVRMGGNAFAARPWAARISRMIVLAGMNRGWVVNSALNWASTTVWKLGTLAGQILYRGRLTIFDIRRGAPFLVETRLQWLKLMQGEDKPKVTIVQTLGTVDDFVSPDDAIDFTIDSVKGGSFFLLEVPNTGHLDAVEMAPPGAQGPRSPAERRGAALQCALVGEPDALRAKALDPRFLEDLLPPPPEPTVKDVVFVIHGIRDRGFWTQKIARKIKEVAAGQGRSFRAVTNTYGYFAMLPFVLPWVRREKVEWLMDLYTETRARFPEADFSYVGHSNGTYLVARALRDYPSARFKRIVFAGSVVRKDYDWASLICAGVGGSGGRVEKVLNYVASGDWVVAIFPKGFQPIRSFDLGSAGHDGFEQAAAHGADIRQVRFVRGSHSAGIKESQWDEIAEFVVNGTPPPDGPAADNPDYVAAQSRLWRACGATAPFLLVVVVAVLAGILWWIVGKFPAGEPAALVAALVVIAVLAYFWILRTVVMRV